MNHRASRHPIIEKLNRWSNRIAYLGLAFAIALSLWLYTQSQDAAKNRELRRQHADDVSRCVAAVDTRTANRAVIEAVYQLATGIVTRDVNAPPLTRAQTIQYNEYVIRANRFRSSTYALLKPSEVCKPYVHDDNVKPPTPDVEPLPVPAK